MATMISKNCVVVEKTTIRHLFPFNDEALFSKLVQSTGNPKLKSLSVQQGACTSAGTKKLNRNAVPTLCLSAYSYYKLIVNKIIPSSLTELNNVGDIIRLFLIEPISCACVLDGIEGLMCLDRSESMIQRSPSRLAKHLSNGVTLNLLKKKPSSLGILKHINVQRRVDLTPKKGRIYDSIKEAKKKNYLLTYRYSS
ncbi:52 kDa repressor of the inhibitor of the protein kinase-like [Aphis craccivora]|uniref:52 kDa repressor of the inhibitor of the protein kinase-like n=1 Tax=Aphis craccivora TaxID=307492 RepID=A0A6G0YI98_APHCR|nr:52 kDa repressor of the inhibitor of the protein kinase-like [Aphis craccivora]